MKKNSILLTLSLSLTFLNFYENAQAAGRQSPAGFQQSITFPAAHLAKNLGPSRLRNIITTPLPQADIATSDSSDTDSSYTVADSSSRSPKSNPVEDFRNLILGASISTWPDPTERCSTPTLEDDAVENFNNLRLADDEQTSSSSSGITFSQVAQDTLKTDFLDALRLIIRYNFLYLKEPDPKIISFLSAAKALIEKELKNPEPYFFNLIDIDQYESRLMIYKYAKKEEDREKQDLLRSEFVLSLITLTRCILELGSVITKENMRSLHELNIQHAALESTYCPI
jgi:hypothetical protein